jgi:hypothetical protein
MPRRAPCRGCSGGPALAPRCVAHRGIEKKPRATLARAWGRGSGGANGAPSSQPGAKPQVASPQYPIRAEGPAQYCRAATALMPPRPQRWDGPSALGAMAFALLGAAPQAGIVRAFGPVRLSGHASQGRRNRPDSCPDRPDNRRNHGERVSGLWPDNARRDAGTATGFAWRCVALRGSAWLCWIGVALVGLAPLVRAMQSHARPRSAERGPCGPAGARHGAALRDRVRE